MTTSDRILTTSDVAIKEVAIEIKVLKIGNKQMTLAVFRQLLPAALLDSAGNFRGTPWGKINYHFDCNMDAPHIHVIWQKGNELRRSCEYSPENSRTDDFLMNDPVGKRWMQSYIYLWQLDQLFIAV